MYNIYINIYIFAGGDGAQAQGLIHIRHVPYHGALSCPVLNVMPLGTSLAHGREDLC